MIRITNIQRFSLQDGPGIRTTVFLKGCSLHCPWCSNPENINFNDEKYYDNDKKENGKFGYEIGIDDLFNEIMKDKDYYKINNGGVTFSGGEALLQFNQLEPLLKKLKDSDINICVETCLFVPTDDLEIAIKYVDEFFVDIKILNESNCNEVLGGKLTLYYNNIEILLKNVKQNRITFRMPVTKEYVLEEENMIQLEKFIRKYKIKNIEIFKIHNLGEKKYRVLGKEQKKFNNISNEELMYIKNKLNSWGANAKIIEI